MKKFLLALPILAVLCVIGFKLALIHHVKSVVDNLITDASPFGEITYSGIYTDFSGTVGIEGLTIAPYGIEDTITVEQSLLHFPSLWDLYNADHLFDDGFPPAIGMSMVGMQMNMAGAIAGEFYQEKYSEFGYIRYIGALGCGHRSTFNVIDLLDMGYRQVKNDATFSYTLDAPTQTISITIESGTRDMFKLHADLDLALGTNTLDIDALLETIPLLSRLHLTFEDQSYLERVITFCAAKTQLTPEAYVRQHVQLVTQQLAQSGFAVGEKMQQAYHRFLLQPRTFSIRLNPSSPADLTGLSGLASHDIIQWLNVEVSVNDDIIDLDLASATAATSVAKPASKPTHPKMVTTFGPPTYIDPLPDPLSEREKRPHYQQVDVDQAKLYIGQKAKLSPKTGRTHTGILTDVQGDVLVLKIRKHSGYIVYKVQMKLVKGLEIYY